MATVEFFVRMPVGTGMTFRSCDPMQRCALERSVKGTGGWVGVVLADPAGKPTISFVDGVVDTGSSAMSLDLDDVAFSDLPQPHAIRQRPRRRPVPLARLLLVRLSVPMRLVRVRDQQGRADALQEPAAFPGLQPGPYSSRPSVAAVDIYGERDPTPAQAEVHDRAAQPRAATAACRAATATPTASPTRATTARWPPNSYEKDGDAHGVGNALRPAPAGGNVPPKPGETSVVKVVSGEVFVKLRRCWTGARQVRRPARAAADHRASCR